MTIHTGAKAYPCLKINCGKSFPTAQKLRSHVKTHNENRYLCSDTDCYFTARTWTELLAHTKSQHPIQCAECLKTFTTTFALREHYKTHQSLESRTRFPCEECGKEFASRKSLTVHVRTVHLGEKPFLCEVLDCGRRFGHKHLLARHKRLHEGVATLVSCAAATAAPNAIVGVDLDLAVEARDGLNTPDEEDSGISLQDRASYLFDTDNDLTPSTSPSPTYSRLPPPPTITPPPNSQPLSDFLADITGMSYFKEHPVSCKYPDCVKRFRNQKGLGVHVRTMHFPQKQKSFE